mmetsp:Transcript_71276/g.115637  ORF Transcript_71276/g.115637 Transcript_71276/m.115637 type:complete len:107 (-) Transcript_71276:26-346(-)
MPATSYSDNVMLVWTWRCSTVLGSRCPAIHCSFEVVVLLLVVEDSVWLCQQRLFRMPLLLRFGDGCCDSAAVNAYHVNRQCDSYSYRLRNGQGWECVFRCVYVSEC